MRRLLVALVLACAAPLAGAQRAVLVDRIVAVVNKEVITATELADRVAQAERQLRRQNIPLPEPAALERQILEILILEKAQLQLAADSGLRVDELQLDRTVQRIADGNKLTLAEFRKTLEAEGVSFERFRADVRKQMLLQRVREREVDDRVQVSDGEIDIYLELNRTASESAVEYNAAHILVRIPEQASPERIEQARARAEQARSEALGGGDFGRLAATLSDAGDALQGGALGWRAPNRLPELFADTLKTMKPGEVSPLLRSPAGFHLLKLLDRRGTGSAAAVTQTRVSHILIKTSELMSEGDARRRVEVLRQRIVAGASFAELARLNSEDGSAARGGNLGWVLPGDTVPEFELAMLALKPGELSEPVRTPFGFHLLLVTERRTADVGAERQRMQTRQVLRERKAEEAYQEWLRQLRDRTYVELKLEER